MNDKLKTTLLFVAIGLGVINTAMILNQKPSYSNQNVPSYNGIPSNNGLEVTSKPKTSTPLDNQENSITPSLPQTKISFTEYEHNYGEVNQQTDNEYFFEFKNTGNEPLVIENAKGSCGCTVPDYPKEPIAPGQKGEIKVIYSSRTSQGNQEKKVTVTANTEPRNTILTIKANVIK